MIQNNSDNKKTNKKNKQKEKKDKQKNKQKEKKDKQKDKNVFYMETSTSHHIGYFCKST
jgi:hypothetical protein